MRRYDTSTYKKHKRPKAWGSPCPDYIDTPRAQVLLETGCDAGDAVYNVDGEYSFRAFKHEEVGGEELWHGHPIPWTRLPASAKNDLIAAGRLDATAYRKAIRKKLGREFDA